MLTCKLKFDIALKKRDRHVLKNILNIDPRKFLETSFRSFNWRFRRGRAVEVVGAERDLRTCQSSPRRLTRTVKRGEAVKNFVRPERYPGFLELFEIDTSRIPAPRARNRYEDDRYGAPGTATLNRTVLSSWDPRGSGAECRVLAPPPQGDVFSCTKPQ